MAVKFTESFRKGNIFTKLSILIPGLGNLVGKQIIKGIMYIAIEAAFVCFMIMKGINCLAMLPDRSRRYGMKSLEYMSMLQVIIHFLYFCME